MKTSRDALLATAFRLFLTKGYEQTSMQDLARASGLSKGAFHHYFPRKQDLLEACLERFFHDFLPDTGETAEGAGDVAHFARAAARKYAAALALMVENDIPLAAYQAFVWAQVRAAPARFQRHQAAFLDRLTRGLSLTHPQEGAALARHLAALIEGTGARLSITPPESADAIRAEFDAVVARFFAALAYKI